MQSINSRIPLKEEVFPYFQPIISLQNQEIAGYESLGRRVRNDGVESLGPFFTSTDVPEEHQLHIDRYVRELAINRLAAAAADRASLLFLNLKPSWIYKAYKQTGTLPTIELLKKYKIDPKRIVIEITEEEFKGRLQELTQIVHQYREAGCTIAIDDVGSGFSDVHRIASLQPKILKIDLNILKRSATHAGYRALMQSFSSLAEQMGASLLIEGVETKQELHQAMQSGARYVQGFLFSKAEADFQDKAAFKPMLREEMNVFSQAEFQRHNQLLMVKMSLSHLAGSAVVIHNAEDADKVIERIIIGTVTDSCIRIYICKEDGYQISSNYFRGADGWKKNEEYRGSNWIWRPYFISNILIMNMHKQGILSQAYTDLETSRSIQTFSCALGEGYYAFLDLLL